MKVKYTISVLVISAMFKSQEKDSLNQNFSTAKNTVSIVAGTNYIDNTFGLNYGKNIYELKANDAFYAEFFLRYRFIDATFSFAPKFLSINNDDKLKGKTTYFNLGFAFFPGSKFRQFAGLSMMKGLYLADSKRFFNDISASDAPPIDFTDNFIFPNAEYLSFQGETSYLWKGNKENYRPFTNMTYQPTKNEWIIMTGLAYQYNIMRNTNTVRFQDVEITDPQEDSPSRDLKIAIKSGVGMQRVFGKNWYAIAELYPQVYYARIISERFHDFNIGLNSAGRFGYDNGRFFAGVSGMMNWTNNRNENFYSFTHWQARIGFGIRFNNPKFAEKVFDKAEEKFNNFKKKHGN
ncbi:DUF4421 domain-containing protein [Chryseobacterium foetidum]|uniref:DUF4421 domain-containing protein n=1 Tax=Chryseobacterium foetidum TaxID=2951057 RepID=UPI0021C9F1F2|nr:DUF4421 domain-containing protein [Chryseobacterium foetidum]